MLRLDSCPLFSSYQLPSRYTLYHAYSKFYLTIYSFTKILGLEVVSGISIIITLLDTSIKIYDNTRNSIKLSKTFEYVRYRLPIILYIL